MKPRVVFLHIPKTAGQSVHSYLVNAFGSDNVFPARVNHQFYQYSRSELLAYQIFSGHFDWSLLDCLPEPVFTFTILRDPIDRIVSFYLYLRREASKLEPAALNLPSNAGKKAVLRLSPDDYFINNQSIRKFVDDHYDNFYTYFFAGRAYDARTKVLNAMSDDWSQADKVSKALQIASENLAFVKKVYFIDEWQSRLGEDLYLFSGVGKARSLSQEKVWKVNKGDSMTLYDRLHSILEIGATKRTFIQIRDYATLDKHLIETYFEKSNISLEKSFKVLEKFT